MKFSTQEFSLLGANLARSNRQLARFAIDFRQQHKQKTSNTEETEFYQ